AGKRCSVFGHYDFVLLDEKGQRDARINLTLFDSPEMARNRFLTATFDGPGSVGHRFGTASVPMPNLYEWTFFRDNILVRVEGNDATRLAGELDTLISQAPKRDD